MAQGCWAFPLVSPLWRGDTCDYFCNGNFVYKAVSHPHFISQSSFYREMNRGKPVHPKGNQSSILIRRTDAEAEAPVLLFLEAAPIYCPTNSVGNNMHALFKHALLSNVNPMCMIQRGIIRGCTFYHVLQPFKIQPISDPQSTDNFNFSLVQFTFPLQHGVLHLPA